MTGTHREYTLWVTPAEPLKSTLKAAITKLYREFDAVDFDPHVTIYAGRSNDEEALRLGKMISETFPPITLRAVRLEQSDALTKTFYVQFEESAGLRRMTDMLRSHSAQPSDYELNPHLSLLYQLFIDETVRKELCNRTDVAPIGDYRFDGLTIYEMDIPLRDLNPIRTWRKVSEFKLGA